MGTLRKIREYVVGAPLPADLTAEQAARLRADADRAIRAALAPAAPPKPKRP